MTETNAETTYDVYEQARWLLANSDKLPVQDVRFATDISKAILAGGYQDTEGRRTWVTKMYTKAKFYPVSRPTLASPAPVAPVADLSGITAFLGRANGKLRQPGITVTLKGMTYNTRIKMAKPGRWLAGQYKVTSEDGRAFYGRITDKGEFFPANKYTPVEIIEGLKDLNTDPERKVIEQGIRTGRCCFCNTPLEDERSTAVGFGPVCARHYGLEAQWKGGLQEIATNVEKDKVIEKRRAQGKAVGTREPSPYDDVDGVYFE